jgi:hypothetical protein
MSQKDTSLARLSIGRHCYGTRRISIVSKNASQPEPFLQTEGKSWRNLRRVAMALPVPTGAAASVVLVVNHHQPVLPRLPRRLTSPLHHPSAWPEGTVPLAAPRLEKMAMTMTMKSRCWNSNMTCLGMHAMFSLSLSLSLIHTFPFSQHLIFFCFQ